MLSIHRTIQISLTTIHLLLYYIIIQKQLFLLPTGYKGTTVYKL